VDFGNEGTTIIPFSRIVGGSTDNGRCCVKWPDGKEYDAALVFAGKTIYYYINGFNIGRHSQLFYLALFVDTKRYLHTPNLRRG